MFNNRLALVNAIWLTIWHWLMCNGNFITGPYWNDHFNVYFLLNNSRQDKCWMAYRDSLPLKIAWWNYLFLSFACWTVCPVSALVQWKGIFLHNLWSIFLFRIIWYEPIFFLGEILNHLGLAVVSGLELKKLKDAASRDNFFLQETIKRFFYNSGKFERIWPSIQIFFVATGRNYT